MLLSILMVMAGSYSHAKARPLIQDVLLVGDSWELTVNDKRDNLIIRGVKGRQTKNSTSTFNYQIVWGGHSGVLRAVTNSQNSSQFVALELTDKNGISQTCRGHVAQNTTVFMAGSCGSKIAQGAWYALRNNRELASTINTKANQEMCDAKVHKCQLRVDRLTESTQNLSKQILLRRQWLISLFLRSRKKLTGTITVLVVVKTNLILRSRESIYLDDHALEVT